MARKRHKHQRHSPATKKHRKGFTLIELVVVTAIIGILTTGTLSALNVPFAFRKGYDAQRQIHVKELNSAMYQNLIDTWHMPGEAVILEGEEHAKPICKEGVPAWQCQEANAVELGNLPPEYISMLPVDPVIPETEMCIGYTVYTQAGRPKIKAMNMGKLPNDAPEGTCGNGFIGDGIVNVNGTDEEPGVAGVDDDANGTIDDESEQGWEGSDDEECDDGNTVDGDGCDDHGKVETGWNCGEGQSSCSVCGNDLREGAEVCDGTDLGGATCADQGFFAGDLACGAGCASFVTDECNMCGNGTVDDGEQCDEGEENSDEDPDGCSTDCTLPPSLLRLDFNGFGPDGNGHTAAGFSPVNKDQMKTAQNTYGWLPVGAWYYERQALTSELEKLYNDGHDTGDAFQKVFEMDVRAGHSYILTLLTGDVFSNHNNMQFSIADPQGETAVPANITTTTKSTQFPTYVHFRTLVFTTGIIQPTTPGDTTGKIQMTMIGNGRFDRAVILGIDVRGADAVLPITIMRQDPAESGPFNADGITTDTYIATGAPPNAPMNVRASNGFVDLLTGPDPNTNWFVGQIVSDANGSFTFTVTRPVRSEPVTIIAEEYMGAARGTYIQEYVPGVRFDVGISGSPIQTEFVEAIPQTVFEEAKGYGWTSRVAGADRKDTNMSDMSTDFDYAADATFQVRVPSGTYNLRVYHCNPQYYGTIPYTNGNFNVYAEGALQYLIPNITPGTCDNRTFSITVADDMLDLRLVNAGGNFNFSGLDLFTGELPAEAP